MPTALQAYASLTPADRQAVMVTAILGAPIPLTQLKMLLKELGIRDDNGRMYYIQFDGGRRDRLVRHGVWRSDEYGIACLPELIEPLIREAREQGLLESTIQQVQQAQPYGQGGQGLSMEEANRRLRRDFRFAALLGEPDRVFRTLGYARPGYLQASPRLAEELTALFGDRLGECSPEFQFLLASPPLEEGEMQLADRRDAYARFEAQFGALPSPPLVLANSLARRRLMRGAFEEAAAVAHPQGILRMTLVGAAAFMRGEDREAIARFDEALKHFRKAEGKRAVHLDGLAGVFHLLALLREGSAGSRKILEAQLKAAAKPRYRDAFQPWFQLLDATCQVLDGKRPFDVRSTFFVLNPQMDPWTLLFQSLCFQWLGGQAEPARVKQLETNHRLAVLGGYRWYAREAALLLQAWGQKGDFAADIVALDCKPLIDLHQPEAAWERTLRLLREMAAPAATPGAVAEAEADQRLVWEVRVFSPGDVTFEPKEQKRKARGWTSGRVVSLKRLRDETESFPYLTPEDRALCACIQAEQTSWGWGGIARTEYHLDPLCALRAAVGHPRLLTQRGPVELVRDQARLVVSRGRNDIHIALHPPCVKQARFAVIDEGARLRFVEFTPQHQRVGEQLGAQGLKVPKAAEARVLETIAAIAPMITVHSEIGGDAGGAVEQVEADPRLHLQLQPLGEGLRIACQVRPLGEKGPFATPGEGAVSIFSEIEGKRLHAKRDLKAERAAANRLFAACDALDPETWEWPLDDPDPALATLEALQGLGDAVVLEWPLGRAVRLARNEGLKGMQVKVGGQSDWFAVSGELTLDDGRVMDMARLLELITAAPGRFVKIGEDEYLALSQELRKRLHAIHSLQDRGRIHPLAAGLLDEALEGITTKSDKGWKEQMRRLAEAAELAPEVPSTLQAELRDYQAEGFRWLARLAHWGAGACLADDMGLGKTVQTLALLLARAGDGPALVVAPTSVCANWIEEARRFAPTLNAQTFGPGDRAAMLAAAGPFDLIVCSYGLLQTESEALTKIQWRTIVADEAQAFKNAQTKRSQAIMSLQGAFRLITTGTPIENHLGELWNLFRFINPGLLGSADHFNQRFAAPIEQRQDKEAGRQLKRLIRPFILRRLKSEVLSELPSRTEITIHVELSDEERVFYEALRRTALERIAQVGGQGPGDARFQVLAEIMRLRRACCNPRLVLAESPIVSSKLQAFGEIVEELRENRHKALVFSQFVDHLSLMREWLDQQKIPYQYLDGSTPAKKRQAAVNAFQGGQGDLFLISLKAGGAGLNLTAADYVIHLDPWWNPAVEDQASDRAHRMGQLRPVTIYRLVARQTIEEQILELHRHKRDLADSLLEGAEMATRLGVEEMMALLKEAGQP